MSENHELRSWNATYGGTFDAISESRYSEKDKATLARLGKQQVLKASSPPPNKRTNLLLIGPSLTLTASLWLSLAFRLQLHNPHNLGNSACVRDIF